MRLKRPASANIRAEATEKVQFLKEGGLQQPPRLPVRAATAASCASTSGYPGTRVPGVLALWQYCQYPGTCSGGALVALKISEPRRRVGTSSSPI
eukprot:448988-Rhodomonas_salina.1